MKGGEVALIKDGLTRLCCDIPKDLKIRLKIKAAEAGKRENALVKKALEQYLGIAC